MSEKLTVIRGDTLTLNFTVTDQSDVAVDLTGKTLFFTVKKKGTRGSDSDDSQALLAGSQDTFDDPPSGEATIAFTATQTNSLVPGLYIYDVQIVDGSGNVVSSFTGTFEVLADVTRRTAD